MRGPACVAGAAFGRKQERRRATGGRDLHRLQAVPSETLKLANGDAVYVEYDKVKLEWIGTQVARRGQHSPGPKRYPRAETATEVAAAALQIPAPELPPELRVDRERLDEEVRHGPRFACPCCRYITLYSEGRWVNLPRSATGRRPFRPVRRSRRSRRTQPLLPQRGTCPL